MGSITLLDDLPRLRLAFPQILGLRDLETLLSAVVNKGVVERSISAIENARDIAGVFVPTDSYRRALSCLENHSCVILTGAPEMGKTTIASMIGLAQLSQGWEFIDCYHPDDFFDNYNSGAEQVFVADDAFGSTEYLPSIAAPWGYQLPKILRKVDKRHWLIWTSRPSPLHFALQHLSLSGPAKVFPEPFAIQVDASTLSLEEKAVILYRHAKAANLEEHVKQLVRAHARRIVSNEYVTPERIRRFVNERASTLANEADSSDLATRINEAVIEEISSPTPGMVRSFENIDAAHQNLMIALLDVDSRPISEVSASEAYYRLFREEADLPPEKLFADLDGHFLRRKRIPRFTHRAPLEHFDGIDWVHPSWRDIAIDFLSSRKKRRTLFLTRCKVPGIQLALSIGGGSKGERMFPIIVHDDDIADIARRVSEIGCQDSYDASRVFQTVKAAINGTEEESANRKTAERVGTELLRAISLKSHSKPISPTMLRDVMGIWKLVASDEIEIHFAPSWDFYLSRLMRVVDQECDAPTVAERIDEFSWCVIAAKLIAPGFLDEIGFPEVVTELLVAAAKVIGNVYADADAKIEYMEGELETLNDWAGQCEWIAEVLSVKFGEVDDAVAQIEGERERLTEAIEGRKERVRQRAEEEEAKARYYYDELDDVAARKQAISKDQSRAERSSSRDFERFIEQTRERPIVDRMFDDL